MTVVLSIIAVWVVIMIVSFGNARTIMKAGSVICGILFIVFTIMDPSKILLFGIAFGLLFGLVKVFDSNLKREDDQYNKYKRW